MKVVEIFPGISGEGCNAGESVVFLRLYGCNLNCPWCDERHDKFCEMRVVEVGEKILSIMDKTGIFKLLVTGGEPLLQAEELYELIEFLESETDKQGRPFMVYVETNGTIPRGIKLLRASGAYVFFVVSPKKSAEEAVDVFMNDVFPLGVLKFVVDERRKKDVWGFNDILMLIRKYDIPRHYIYLMPLTVDGKMDDELASKVWDFCVENGMNYSDRLHIRLGKR